MGLERTWRAAGDGTETDRSRPVAVDWDGVKAIAAGGEFTLALRTDGTVWAWGANWDGQLGDGTGFSRSSPVNIGLSGVAAIVAAALMRSHRWPMARSSRGAATSSGSSATERVATRPLCARRGAA